MLFAVFTRCFRRKLNEVYEEAVIKKGEMDDRMFIPKDITTVFDETFDGLVFSYFILFFKLEIKLMVKKRKVM